MGGLHTSNPYHRVKWFNGAFYEDAWLRDAGVYLSLCRQPHGQSCPAAVHRPELPDAFYERAPPRYYSTVADPPHVAPHELHRSEGAESESYAWSSPRPETDIEAETEAQAEAKGGGSAGPKGRVPTRGGLPTTDHRGLRVFIVCDDSAIHGLGVQFCSCPGAPSKDMQLIEGGIYPASRVDPSSGFTFRCLQGFLVDNLESDTSAEAYARKLARLTEPDNPDSAPVCFPAPGTLTG